MAKYIIGKIESSSSSGGGGCISGCAVVIGFIFLIALFMGLLSIAPMILSVIMMCVAVISIIMGLIMWFLLIILKVSNRQDKHSYPKVHFYYKLPYSFIMFVILAIITALSGMTLSFSFSISCLIIALCLDYPIWLLRTGDDAGAFSMTDSLRVTVHFVEVIIRCLLLASVFTMIAIPIIRFCGIGLAGDSNTISVMGITPPLIKNMTKEVFIICLVFYFICLIIVGLLLWFRKAFFQKYIEKQWNKFEYNQSYMYNNNQSDTSTTQSYSYPYSDDFDTPVYNQTFDCEQIIYERVADEPIVGNLGQTDVVDDYNPEIIQTPSPEEATNEVQLIQEQIDKLQSQLNEMNQDKVEVNEQQPVMKPMIKSQNQVQNSQNSNQ